MKTCLITCLLLLFTLGNTLAQNPDSDLSGKWTGVSTYGKEKYQMIMNLDQDGSILSGVISWTTLNKNRHAEYEFNGLIEDDNVELKALKYISKKGMSCLPTHKLKLSKKENKLELSGKWGSNNVWGGCLWGFSGDVNFQKSVEHIEETVVSSNRPIKKDAFTTEIVNRLKTRKYHALIIGVEAYIDHEMNDLDRPVKDAESLVSVLREKYTFDSEDITFLSNPSRSDIIESFDNLSEKVGETDNLLVFYAGHGIWDEKLKQGYWLPADAKKTSKAQWLSNSTIRDYVRAIPAKHTLLIADACFSGGILKQRNAFNTTRAMVEMYKLPSRKAMTSGTLKTVPDKSVFLEYLVKKMNDNTEAIISADQLFADLRIAVIHNSPNNQLPQYGVIHGAGDEGGDFLFLRRD